MSVQPQLFVSHCHADNEWCGPFVSALRVAGVDVWYDEDNLGYHRLTTDVQRELQNRPFFTVVLSPQAVVSQWVLTEWTAALALFHDEPDRRVIVPIIAKRCPVPLFLRTFHYITQPNPVAAATRFVTRVFQLDLPTSLAAGTSALPLIAPIETVQTVEEAVSRGQSLLAQERGEEALAAFEQALALDPSAISAWQGKADVLQHAGRLVQTIETLNEAVQLAPKNAQLWSKRGQVQGRLERWDEALTDVNHALALDRTRLGAWLNKSTILRYLGRVEEALAAADEAIRLNAQFGAAWVAKGNALMKLNRHGEALAAYELGTQLITPTVDLVGPPERASAVALTNKGNAYFLLNLPSPALSCYEDALAQDMLYAAAWIGKGNVLLRRQRYPSARDAYAHALACGGVPNSDQARAYFGRGASLERLEDHHGAYVDLTQAVHLDPTFAAARLELADVCLRLKKHDAALQAFQEAATRDSDPAMVATAWNGIGLAYAGLGDHEQALVALKRSMSYPEGVTRAGVNRVQLLQSWGRLDEAEQAHQELMAVIYDAALTRVQQDSRTIWT